MLLLQYKFIVNTKKKKRLQSEVFKSLSLTDVENLKKK